MLSLIAGKQKVKRSLKELMEECIKVNSEPGIAEKRPAALSGAPLFAVLLFACLFVSLFALTLNASPAHAADSGVNKGVPWRITDDYDLILGEEDKTYNLGDLAIGTDIPGGQKIKRVYSLGKLIAGPKCRLFNDCKSLTSINLSSLDTSKVTDMSYMLSGCESLKSLRLSGFDTRNVKDMSFMFCGCYSLESLTLDGFDTGNVTNMMGMFHLCEKLKRLDLSGFDTSSAENMVSMFSDCYALADINVSSFDTSNVTDMSDMFLCCGALKSLNVSNFDTGKVKEMNSMFDGCKSLKNLDLRKFDTGSAENMSLMFGGCESLTNLDLRSFDTSKVKDMSFMFEGCKEIKSINLSSFDTGNVEYVDHMFLYCYALKRLNLSRFVIGRDVDKSYMFDHSGIKQVALGKNTMLNGCNQDKYDTDIITGPGPWKRISTLDGKQANGPVLIGLEEYTGSAPGWYRFLSPNPIKLKGKTVKIKRKYIKKKAKVIKRAKALQVTNAQGKVTYQLTGVKKAKYKKYFKVNTKNGNITVRKKLKKGTYRLSIKAMAAGNNWYNKATAGATVVIKVK